MPASVPASVPALVRRLRVAAAVVPLAALAGCGGVGQPQPYDQPGINGLVIPTPSPDAADFVDVVDNPWLPLQPGTRWTYDVTRDGNPAGRLVVDVRDGTIPVDGLAATAVETTTDPGDGGTASVETRLYAQDDDGNVWVVGEELAAGSWRAGEDGAEAGLVMPAHLRIGDGWPTYLVPSLPRASRQVEELSDDMVQMHDEADTESRSVYEKGVGLVSIEDLDDGWIAVLVPNGPS
ncbi:hypothetical protein L2K70_14385 [Nocardioides KLBMP 9356]|uniref:Lipoprotein n=1 Tax=Nocardioides potassii TaxID=2911371 RepID=A0ABS9HF00_9ACTN|nr:hypothetical protein [Nocardioides potassii]MCF6378799.1 hypothetical protein [Nocardioides potassii]